MGLIHQIQIIEKYVKDGRIVWYTDSLGNRYTYDDIVYILKTRNLPQYLYVIQGRLNKELYTVEINMKFWGNTIRCTTQELESKTIKNKDIICVITEDSNSGYILIYNLLTRQYPDIEFKFVAAQGNTTLYNVYKQISKFYRKYILVTDNKQSSSAYLRVLTQVIQSAKNTYGSGSLIHIKPVSVEELLLSWLNLQIKHMGNYRNDILQYYKTGIEPFIYQSFGHDNYLIIKTGRIVNNMEIELFRELTDISYFSYNKSVVGHCIYSDCFLTLDMKDKKVMYDSLCKHKLKCFKNKVNNIFEHSLFCIFDNAINLLEGRPCKYLSQWSQMAKNKLYELY